MEKDLTINMFYWVLIPVEFGTDDTPQPAQFVGNNKWKFIGFAGVSDMQPRWIGPIVGRGID